MTTINRTLKSESNIEAVYRLWDQADRCIGTETDWFGPGELRDDRGRMIRARVRQINKQPDEWIVGNPDTAGITYPTIIVDKPKPSTILIGIAIGAVTTAIVDLVARSF